MKPPSTGLLAVGAIGLIVLKSVAIGAPTVRRGAPPAPAPSAPVPIVSTNGFSLASASLNLAVEESGFPDGPHADLVNANCMSCHSANMALTQPVLSQDQRKAIVIKMQEVYKAPVAETDVLGIVAYLSGMAGQAGQSSQSQRATRLLPASANAVPVRADYGQNLGRTPSNIRQPSHVRAVLQAWRDN